MKKILIGIITLVLFIFINGCSRSSEPQFRIRNDQSNKVNVKIQTSSNNKFTINDIEPGQLTAYQTAPEGNVTATSVMQNESVSFLAAKNTSYTIVVSTGNPPTLQIEK